MDFDEKLWRGKGRTVDNPCVWRNERELVIMGRVIPSHSTIKQFESTNFGWTIAITTTGQRILTKE